MKRRRYIKRPLPVHAFQWKGREDDAEIRRWVTSFGDDSASVFSEDAGVMRVRTLEGHSYEVRPGDWIIRGVRGEYYPCRPDIFQETYEFFDEA